MGSTSRILTYVVNKSKKIYEIGVSYNARNYKDCKKIRYYDVFNVIFQILLTRIKVIFS